MAKLNEPPGAQHIEVDWSTERFVKLNRCRRMEHNGHIPDQTCQVLFRDAQTGTSDVTGDGHQLIQCYGVAFAYFVEYPDLEQFLESGAHIHTFLWPQQYINVFNTTTASEQFLDQHFAHKTGGAGNKHTLTTVEVGDLWFTFILLVLSLIITECLLNVLFQKKILFGCYVEIFLEEREKKHIFIIRLINTRVMLNICVSIYPVNT